MSPPERIQLSALPDIPEVQPGDDLAAQLQHAAAAAGVRLECGVLVICQKIVSKAEGRLLALDDVAITDEARSLAAEENKDPRHVAVILSETKRIVRRGHGILICETHHGFVCANAGVDLSNAPGPDIAVLLPVDPDASAARLRSELVALGASELGIVISDTFGRPWREGLVDVAIGSAGMAPIDDARGQTDRAGRELLVTAMATPDQLAAAAGLLMIKDSGVAAVWVDGVVPSGEGSLADLLRDPATDFFR
jgi:coenzyme F420-0:L-glutamate ligase/coenzyme F420-1:gamma-L-glutamate ligase